MTWIPRKSSSKDRVTALGSGRWRLGSYDQVEVNSSFEPIIGTEEKSKKLLDKLLNDYENNPEIIWESEIFGRKLSEVVNDGIKAKIYLMPENVQYKMRECLEKIMNKGRGGIIAFIL